MTAGREKGRSKVQIPERGNKNGLNLKFAFKRLAAEVKMLIFSKCD
jgi:hypothetical protein